MAFKTGWNFIQHYRVEFLLFSLSFSICLATGPLFIDDAYIYFRYADHFRSGLGWVFNAGQNVLGFSSYLYMLLLSLPALFGLDIPSIAFFEGILFHSLSTLLIYRIGLKTGLPMVGVLAGFFYAILPRGILLAVSGMETSLLIFLILFCLFLMLEGRFLAAAALTGLIAITRLEGVLFGGAILLAIFFLQRRVDGRKILLYVLPLIGCLLIGKISTHGWLPQTVIAKSIVYPTNLHPLENLGKVLNYLSYPFPAGDAVSKDVVQRLAVLFLGAWGAIIWIRRQPLFSGFLAGLLGIAIGYSILNRYLFPWYLAVLYPLQILLLALAVVDLWQRFQSRLRSLPVFSLAARWMGRLVLLSMTVISLGILASDAILTRRELNRHEQVYATLGTWLNTLNSGRMEVAAVDIGALGFHYQGNLYDLVGLTNPAAVHFYAEPGYQFQYPHLIPPKLILWKQPQILVVYDRFLGNLVQDPQFSALYRPIWSDKLPHPYYGTLMVWINKTEVEPFLTQTFLENAP